MQLLRQNYLPTAACTNFASLLEILILHPGTHLKDSEGRASRLDVTMVARLTMILTGVGQWLEQSRDGYHSRVSRGAPLVLLLRGVDGADR